MKILLWPHPILKKRSESVDLRAYSTSLHLDMLNAMYDAKGVGLSAVQVGILKRVFVLDVGQGPETFINPEPLQTTGDRVPMVEGCLSTPGQFETVWRHPEVTVKHLNYNLIPTITVATGLRAQAIQHEMEHLDGMIFVDQLKPAIKGRIMGAMMKYKRNGGR